MSYIAAIRDGENVIVWERHDTLTRTVRVFEAPWYFYTKDPGGEHTSIYGDKLTRHTFGSSREFYSARNDAFSNGEDVFESDIGPELRILAEHYYGLEPPTPNITFFDIEVDYNPELGFSSIDNPYAPINSVALYHQHDNVYVLLAVAPEGNTQTEDELIEAINAVEPIPDNVPFEFRLVRDEKELLQHFVAEIQDSDIISGWNSDFFDTPYVGKRVEKVLGKKYFRLLSFPEAPEPGWRTVISMGREMTTLDPRGRASLDYLHVYRKYEVTEKPSYKLEAIAEDVLPELPKLEYEGSLFKLYRENFAYFLRYNIRDTEILKGFEDRLGYIALANTMCHISCGQYQHVLGTLKLAELAINNYCHHELNVCVPNIKEPEGSAGIQGAMVLEPKMGMHDWIGSVDINSLYPSAIRSINISPEKIVGQFSEAGNAAQAIADGMPTNLRLEYEDGESEVHGADEWRDILRERKQAVSGFGTVFDQTSKGIIPTVLEQWYATRKKYQKLKGEATDKGDKEQAGYYDRLQYVYKIKLNSLYGALTNQFFRYYDLRMGESTTGTGRMILRHQCSKANEVLTGEYDLEGDAVIYGDSVAGDTIIETENGPIQIQDLFTETTHTKGTKEYCDVSVRTLTFDPSTGRNKFGQTHYVVRHKVNKKMYRVWIGNTRYVDITEDHSLIGYANTRSQSPGLVEIKPTEIGTNHANSLLLAAHLPTTPNPQRILSKEMYQLIGLIVGDGHVERRIESGVGLSVGCIDKPEIIENVISPLIAQGWFTSFTEMKNGHDIRLSGTKGWRFLNEEMYSSGTKDFPSWVFDETPEHIAYILTGYFSADGFANKNKTIGLCSTNIRFIQTANRLLKICGIASNYWTETTENSYQGKKSGTYTHRLTVYNTVRFGHVVGFIQTRKNTNIRTEYSKNTQHMNKQTGYALIQPTRVEEIPQPEYVYDIEVEGTHTFFANDILVHNTDSTYFETWARDKEEAIRIADAVANKVNNSFPEFMRETFLCNEGFDEIIKCGREVVSDRGIFVDKKRYILHLVDLDGWACDKLKVMGLDTKKTTLPKPIATKLNGFVEALLKGQEWDDVAQNIVDYKDEVETTTNIMSIGLPKGIRGLEEYTTAYKLDKTTRLPGHVAAAIHYNLALQEFGDQESIPITSGMKIKVFYLKQVKGRFKSIAVPTDIEVVPQWFLDNYEINRNAHVERLVDNPLKNIFKAINKDVPDKQSLVVDDLLDF